MGTRRRARELSLQFLYQIDSSDEQYSDPSELESAISYYWESNHPKLDDETKEFSSILIKGSYSNLKSIDDIITKYSKHWSLSRMSRIDRNILRMAIYELIYMDSIPTPVTINEAVELGKIYGTEESGSFINGILDSVRLAWDKGEL